MKQLKKLTKFTVKRSEWLTPDFSPIGVTSCLLNGEGRKCCLGFAMLKAGASESEILGRLLPSYVKDIIQSQFIAEVDSSSKLSLEAATINDDNSITNQVREEKLIDLFSAAGIKVNFID